MTPIMQQNNIYYYYTTCVKALHIFYVNRIAAATKSESAKIFNMRKALQSIIELAKQSKTRPANGAKIKNH